MLHEIFLKNVKEIQDEIFNFNPIKLEPSDWVEQTVFLIPSYGEKLNDNSYLCTHTRVSTSEILKLK